MDFKKQLQDKNEFLRKAYETVYQEYPSSPLSVSLDPIEFGKSLGFDEDATYRIMQELVDDGFVTSSIGMGMLMVTNDGLNYLRNLEIDPKSMIKQSEKLDIILRSLYDLRFDGKYYSLKEILTNNNVNSSVDEVFALGKKLEADGHINFLGSHNDVFGSITTEGIEYVEDDSYSVTGSPITNNHYNISIVNSPNANYVNRSSNVSISQSFNGVDEVIKNIRETIQKESGIDREIIENVLECLGEIEHTVKNGGKPKYAVKSLLDIAGGISSVASWITVLGQFAGIIPIPK